MTTPSFIRDVAAESGVRITDARCVVQAIEVVMRKYLSSGEKFKLADVSFEAKEVPAHEARNPSTGETITVEAHKKVVAKVASNLARDVR